MLTGWLEDYLRERIDVNKLLRDYRYSGSLKGDFTSRCKEIQRLVFPAASKTPIGTPDLTKGRAPDNVPDDRSNYSSAVISRVNRDVSNLYSLLCNSSDLWLGVSKKAQVYPFFDNSAAVTSWVLKLEEWLRGVFNDPESKFGTAAYSVILEWYTYGMGAIHHIYDEAAQKNVFAFVPIDQILVEMSGLGEIDVVYRTMRFTPRQAYGLWGDRIAPQTIDLLVRDSTSTAITEYVEIVFVNPFKADMLARFATVAAPGVDVGELSLSNYLSCVIEVSSSHLVCVDLIRTLPYATPRFNIDSGLLYGRSFVSDMLTVIEELNRMVRLALMNNELIVQPPVLIDSTMMQLVSRIAPRAFIPVEDPIRNPGIQPLPYGSDPKNLYVFIDYLTKQLDDLLLVPDLFFPDNIPKTKYEISARERRAANITLPLIERLTQEFLTPLVKSVLSFGMTRGLIPAFPYEELFLEIQEQAPGYEIMEGVPLTVDLLRDLVLPNPLDQLQITFEGQGVKRMRKQEIFDMDSVVDLLQKLAVLETQLKSRVADKLDFSKLAEHVIEILLPWGDVITDIRTRMQAEQSRMQVAAAAAKANELAMEKIKLENEGIQLENEKLKLEIE
jgi:hypothetical protein